MGKEEPILHRSKKSFRFLKEYDMFRVPIKTYYHKYETDVTNKSTHDMFGSNVGGILTLLLQFSLAAYFVIMVIRMFSGENDIINMASYRNAFRGDYQSQNLGDFAFLPHVSILPQSNIYPMQEFDIWDQNGNFEKVNATKVFNYVEIVLIMRI